MARKSTKKVSQAASSAPAANGTTETKRNRNEMWYAVVGTKANERDMSILLIMPTVGQIRKRYAELRNFLNLTYPDCKLVRCVVVPFERPADEPEETETATE